MTTDKRLIAVVNKQALFDEIKAFHGYRQVRSQFADTAAFSNYAWKPRAEMEEDPQYLQLIPYVVVRHEGRVIVYRRSPAGTEGRLHGLFSIGLGGHVDWDTDAKYGPAVSAVLQYAAKRELQQELHIATKQPFAFQGLLYDGVTSVGRVHLGIVCTIELSDAQELALQETSEVPEYTWMSLSELENGLSEAFVLEPWSLFVFSSMREGFLT